MQLFNKTKNIILAKDIVLADTPFKRMKGLLGRKGLREGEGLAIIPCSAVHTFFMSFCIDIIFADKGMKVIKTISSLKPFSLTPPIFRSYLAIELPAGILRKTATAKGDTLVLA
jgi:uncharacterized membrane protein (UPF0127 family)